MDPFQMLNNDMSQLIMSTKPLMEEWKDKNADQFSNQCIGILKNEYNRYINQINSSLRQYMIYENKCQNWIKRLMELNEK